ncbi:SDR family NAD(P)-dependent oxidoreductase [Auritidibacter ignavus]|uniref:SDR family NAD(P)-dependent oxidoreductase n=1 Tax=Auritidibacter ignavus TaxID=678932 RepID=UPI002FE5D939
MRWSIVTGGASGIGYAVAKALIADGHKVIVVDQVPPPTNLDTEYFQADIGIPSDIGNFAATIRGREIHDLVHCAAVGQWSLFTETSPEDWSRILRVNLEGTAGIVREVLPSMQHGGRIVLFASGTVFKGVAGMTAYTASKAGVIGFARSLSHEVGEKEITVNVVSPGITRTPMIEEIKHTEAANIATRAIKRSAVPEDLIGPVRFLLSDAASFITGQTMAVDGGSVKL